MKGNLDNFAKDIALCSFDELAKKYMGRVLSGTKISDIVSSLEKQRLLDSLVRNDWRDDGKDKNGIYLIQSGDRFEVFTGERGIKNWKEDFGDIKSACTAFIDALLNELHYIAEDSKIR